jgi:hypothetical protein
LQLKSIDRRHDAIAILRRRLHDRRRGGEGDHADAYILGLLGDKGFGSGLRRGNAIGLHVIGAHTAGNIHGEDDGLVL